LIADESALGPAFLPGGVSGYFGVEPCMAVHGASLAFGAPLGVLAGSQKYLDILESGASGLDRALTKPAHPLSLSALSSSLDHMAKNRKEIRGKVLNNAKFLFTRLGLWFQEKGVSLRLRTFGPYFAMEPLGPAALAPTPENVLAIELFHLLLLESGVFPGTFPDKNGSSSGVMVVGAPHLKEDAWFFSNAVMKSVLALKDGGFGFEPPREKPVFFFPLSGAREKEFAGYEREGGQGGAGEVLGFRIEGRPHVPNVKNALFELASRHEALNFSVRRFGDGLYRVLEDEAPFRLKTVSDFVSETPEDAVRLFLTPHNLGRAPLATAGLIDRGDHFLFVLESLKGAIDRESLKILAGDLNVLMKRKEFLPPRPQAGEAEAGIEALLAAKNSQGATRAGLSLDYWKNFLGDFKTAPLPLDNPLLKNSGRHRTLFRKIEGRTLAKIKEKIASLGVSPEIFHLGVAGLALRKFAAGISSFVVARHSDGRIHPLSKAAVGSFSRFVPMALANPEPNEGFLARLVDSAAASAAHGDVSVETLSEALGKPAADLSFELEEIDPGLLSWHGVRSSFLPLPPPRGNHNPALRLSETPDGLFLFALFGESLSPKSVKAFGAAFDEALNEFSELSAPAFSAKAEKGAAAPARPPAPAEKPQTPPPTVPAKPAAPAAQTVARKDPKISREPEKFVFPEEAERFASPIQDPFALAPEELSSRDRDAIRKTLGKNLALVLPLAPGQKDFFPSGGFSVSPASRMEGRRALLRGGVEPLEIHAKTAALLDSSDVFRLGVREGEPGANVATLKIPSASSVFSFEDLRGKPDRDKEKRMREAQSDLSRDLARPDRGAPFRVALFRLADDRSELLLATDALFLDAESAWGILDYFSDPDPAPALPRFSAALAFRPENAGALAEARAGAREHFRKKLETLSSPTRVPRRVSHREEPGEALVATHKVPSEFLENLRKAAKRENATLSVFVQGVFAVLLQRLSQTERVSYGVEADGRGPLGIPGAPGPFSVRLPVIVDVTRDKPFATLLGQIAAGVREAEAGAVLSKSDLEDLSPLGPDIFGHAVSFSTRAEKTPNPRLEKTRERGSPGGLPLILRVRESAGDAEFNFVWQRGLYDPWQVEVMRQAFHSLMTDAVENPGATVGSLRLSETDQDLSVVRQNNARAVKREGETVLDLFRAAVAARGDAVAVTMDDFAQSYLDLDIESEKLAAQLKVAGIGPGHRVALCHGDPGPEYPGILLGVLKSGAAAAPLSPKLDPGTLEQLLRDSAPSIAICPERLPDNLLAATEKLPDLPVVDPKGNFLKGGSSGVLGFSKLSGHFVKRDRDKVTLSSDSPAYLVQVSGSPRGSAGSSRGAYRGVLESHGALLNQISWAGDLLGIEPGDVLSSYAPPASDVSVMELLLPLTRGAAILLLSAKDHRDDESLWENIHSHKVTSLSLPLRKLRLYVSRHSLYGLKTIVTWGRGLSGDNIQELIKDNTSCRIVNCYGQPECAITALAEDSHPGFLPETMGRPVPNCPSYILDAEKRLLPAGFPGELHVGGAQVAMGYDPDGEENRKAFVPDPFAPNSPPEYKAGRLFKTGILASRRPDGRIDYIGRMGEVTVINGVAVPVFEVERTLLAGRGILEALVIKREDYDSYFEPYLAAYVTVATRENVREAAIKAEIRRHLEKNLPPYAIPEKIEILDDFPLDAFGRVDIGALPAPRDDDAADDGPAGIPAAGESPSAFPADPGTRAAASAVPAGDGTPGAKDRAGLPPFYAPGTDPFASAPDDLGRGDREKLLKTRGSDLYRVLPPSPGQISLLTVRGTPRLGATGLKGGLWANVSKAREVTLPPVENLISTELLTLSGKLDPDALFRRIGEILASRDVFRLSFFPREQGLPAQVWGKRTPGAETVFSYEDFGSHSTRKRDARLSAMEARHLAELEDITRAPLLRIALLRLADERFSILASFNQLAFDSASSAMILRELLGKDELPENPPSYLDYLERRAAGDAEKTLDHWRRELGKLSSPTLIPFANPERKEILPKGPVELATLKFPDDLAASLRSAAAGAGVSLESFLLGAWAHILGRSLGTAVVSFGCLFSGREEGRETRELAGPAETVLPLIVGLDREKSFVDLAKEIEALKKEARENDGITLRELEALSPLGADAITNLVFSAPGTALDNPDLRVTEFKERARPFSYLISLRINEHRRLSVDFVHGSQTFRPWQITSLSGAFRTVLEGVAADPGVLLKNLRLSSPETFGDHAEHAASLAKTLEGKTVPGLFKKWAALGPMVPAAVMGSVSVTYGELDRHSEKLAASLRRLGVPDRVPRVGVLMERSPAYPGVILGVLKSGGTLVPLPGGDDGGELLNILLDCAPGVIITGKEMSPALAENLDLIPPAKVMDFAGNVLASNSDFSHPESAPEGPEPGSPAYVIYTSKNFGGAGGVGVEITHRALFNTASWFGEFLDLRPGDTQGCYAPFGTDFSLTEILTPLSAGAKCLIFGEAERRDLKLLHETAEKARVSSLWLPPRLVRPFVEEFSIKFLKTLVTIGEGFDEPFRVKDPGSCRIVVAYGIQECGVAISAESAPPGMTPLTLGHPGSNCPVHVLDGEGELVPPGFPGNLYVGGPQVANGYLGHPELTEKVFFPDPYKSLLPPSCAGEKLFAPGITVIRRPDGRLFFVRKSASPPAVPAPLPVFPPFFSRFPGTQRADRSDRGDSYPEPDEIGPEATTVPLSEALSDPAPEPLGPPPVSAPKPPEPARETISVARPPESREPAETPEPAAEKVAVAEPAEPAAEKVAAVEPAEPAAGEISEAVVREPAPAAEPETVEITVGEEEKP
ncbi:MAG: AMP-binding protein, partial [Deltaproteobacteria bacterium]|nr:AMP-binding protein [Deltaproteobacteria bacterium]